LRRARFGLCFGLGRKIAAPPDGEACARPARPTRSLRAPHRHDFDARAFTRALCAGSQNHAGPANLLSCASRLSGLYASLRPSARPRFRFGLARAPHEPPTSGGYRGALVRLQARDGSRTSDNEPSLAITAAQAGLAFCSEPSRAKRVPSRASASIAGCVRKSLLRLRPSAYLTRDHRLGLATTLRQI
jgi:hypothetical protein